MLDSNKRFSFTKRNLTDLEATGKLYQVYDTACRGLVLLVTPTGGKTFYRQGRIQGKVRRVKIGPFPTFSVTKAREKCEAINGNIAEGKPVKTTTRGTLTFGDLWEQYWDEYATVKKAESSRKHDKWQWNKLLKPAWETVKATNIKKADVLELQGRVAKENGKVTANRMLSLAKKIFNHAIEAERLEANPAATVKKYREHSRERFLQPDEAPRFFKALAEFENQDMADFWLMCLFVGARQSNILAMRWRDIDFASAVWTIPKTKSGTSQRIPLVRQAIEILERRRNLSEYVFASHGKTGHLTRPGKAWDRLLAQAGIQDLTMHDLRRSLGSYQAAAGVSELIIGKTLGHAPGSKATSIYARMNLDPVREGMATAAKAIEAAANGMEGKGNE